MLIVRIIETYQLTLFHNVDPPNSNVRGASLSCHCVTSGKTYPTIGSNTVTTKVRINGYEFLRLAATRNGRAIKTTDCALNGEGSILDICMRFSVQHVDHF